MIDEWVVLGVIVLFQVAMTAVAASSPRRRRTRLEAPLLGLLDEGGGHDEAR